MKKLIFLSDGRVLADRVFFARSPWARLRGMIGRRFVSAGFDAMVFENCSAVHCCWMCERIDVVFVSPELTVTKVSPGLRPWFFSCGGRGTQHTIELPAGKVKDFDIKAGDQLKFI